MTTLRSKSPAKVNLTFQVLKKRPDGYHDIETLMQAVSLSDWVSLSLSARDQLTCTDTTIPTDRSNLVFKGLELFRCKTGISDSVELHIEKYIPAGAGLGGGSSNAATTLYLLNQLFNVGIDHIELQKWSAEIGSDVPFFFSSGTALCTGRGEQICDVAMPTSLPTWIAKPYHLSLSTPQVYAHCKPGESLEPAAMRISRRLSDVKAQLDTLGFEKIALTGSGSAFVCYGQVQPQAEGIDFYPIAPLRKKVEEWYT